MKQTILSAIALAALLAPCAAQADEVTFTLRPDGAQATGWGTGQAEHYDVAMLVNDPKYVGWTISYMQVPYFAYDADDIEIWASKELKTRNYNGESQNDPDTWRTHYGEACCGAITAPVANVVIPEGGIYIGYSFTIPRTDQDTYSNPVFTYPGTDPEGLWVHTSGSKTQWEAMTPSTGKVSAMYVTLQSPRPGSSTYVNVGIEVNDITYVMKGDGETTPDAVVNATLLNTDRLELANVAISYEIQGNDPKKTQSNTYQQITVPRAHKGDARVPVQIIMKVPKQDGLGLRKGKVTVLGSNGGTNTSANGSADFQVGICDNQFQLYPVIEEYTGTWCGNCPQGIAAMDNMYWDMDTAPWFIGVSYHAKQNDPMEWATALPHDVMVFPTSFLCRNASVETNGAAYKEAWEDRYWYHGNKTMAELKPTAWWEPDGTAIHCSVTTEMGMPMTGADLRLCYLLVADGLKGDGYQWMQTNLFAGKNEVLDQDPLLKDWVSYSSMVDHMKYDNVVIYSPDLNGLEGSVPAQFASGDKLTHSLDIKPGQVHNLSGESLIQSTTKLRLVVMLLDGNGGMVNAAQCNVSGGEGVVPVGVENVEAGRSVPVYYDLTGRRVAQPGCGVYVRVLDGKADKVRM